MAVASIALAATCAANASERPDTSESTNAATAVLQSAQPSAKPDLVAELKSVEIDGGNYVRLRGLSPSCAFEVFALPFREISAVMAMGVARQKEGARLKFEA